MLTDDDAIARRSIAEIEAFARANPQTILVPSHDPDARRAPRGLEQPSVPWIAASPGRRVAVVGATGQVGTLMLSLPHERNFPAREIVPFASERSAGRELDGGLSCSGLSDESIQGFDLALFSAGGSTSGEWAPRFVDAGAIVIDNSSRWRMNDDVPLVVSEVNPGALAGHHGNHRQPQLLHDADGRRAEAALHEEAGIERLVISTYQAVSGTGRRRSRSCSTSHTRCCTRGRSRAAAVRAPDRFQRAPPRRQLRRRATTTPTRSAS